VARLLRAREVIVIAWREREEVIDVFTNDATCRQSCGDDHVTTLNRGGQWYSDVEMISDARKRDWRRGGCGG
jgi:hypothetical protein